MYDKEEVERIGSPGMGTSGEVDKVDERTGEGEVCTDVSAEYNVVSDVEDG